MAKKIVIFGGAGLVGSGFIDLNKDVFEIVSPTIEELDILEKQAVSKFIEDSGCSSVINFAAFTNVEAAEAQKEDKNGMCYRINAIGAKNVAEVCKNFNKYLIHISTEYVFDGTKADSPYNEEDKQNPVNWYGQTKYFAEQLVLESGSLLTLVRICMPFSPFYEPKKDVARFFLEQLRSGEEIVAIEDQKITPTIVSDIANALKVLVEAEKTGIYHVCSTNFTTPFEFAKMIAAKFGLDMNLVKPISFADYNKNKQAKLLKNSWLDPAKFVMQFGGNILHSVREDIEIFKQAVDGRSIN
ncbi:NAD(P)-dependent oxidoreductase [Patescibacteria group bacterium]|nr:NAD(P)-dependent oxidoreductase [Patescibacteria group bacterium]